MTDARTQRTKAIERLVTCYPRFTLSKATLNAYADHLENIDPIDLERGLELIAKTSTFFPSIAEILQVIDPQQIPPQPPRRTGYTFVRGSHGSTYIRDDEGTDELPKWMDPPA